MKFQITSLFAAALMAGSAAAHSWLECVDTDVTNYAAAKADPTLTVYVSPPPLLPPQEGRKKRNPLLCLSHLAFVSFTRCLILYIMMWNVPY